MALKVSRQGPITILTPEGVLWGGEETTNLRRAIDEEIRKGNLHLVFDLTSVTHVNPVVLGLLVASRTNYQKRGGNVVLCNVEKQISNILLITKLAMVFDVYRSLEDAITSFSSKPV